MVRLIEANDKGRRFRLWLCVERVLGQLLALVERVEQSVADRTIVEEQPPAALRLAASGSYCHPLKLQPSALGRVSNLCSFKFHGVELVKFLEELLIALSGVEEGLAVPNPHPISLALFVLEGKPFVLVEVLTEFLGWQDASWELDCGVTDLLDLMLDDNAPDVVLDGLWLW